MRLPVRQGKGNGRNGDPESRGTKLWLSQYLQAQGEKGWRQGTKKVCAAEPLPAGRGQDPLGHLELPCGVLGKEAEGSQARAAVFDSTVWHILGGKEPWRSLNAFTQSQGDPNGRPCAGKSCSALTPIGVPWERSVPSLPSAHI